MGKMDHNSPYSVHVLTALYKLQIKKPNKYILYSKYTIYFLNSSKAKFPDVFGNNIIAGKPYIFGVFWPLSGYQTISILAIKFE